MDNAEWVTKIVNRMKTDMSKAEFLDMCLKISTLYTP